MANKSDAEESAEQTLITLEQLSQTLEVMTCVVDRLRLHLDRQLSLTAELFEDEQQLLEALQEEQRLSSEALEKDSYIVEISQRELDEGGDYTVH